jgi:molecular chaperone GrpE
VDNEKKVQDMSENTEEERKKTSPSSEMESEKVKRLEDEVSSLKDMYLRKQAEFENFRKRMIKEKEDIAVYANKQLMEEFISLMDNFERAISSSAPKKDFDQFLSGISLIKDSFFSSLQSKYGLEPFGKEGESFNPEKHEAISVENDPKVKEPLIKEVFQKGYSLKDRVLRTAKVKVVQP